MEKYIDVVNVDSNTGKKTKKYKFCPKCGSLNIDWVLPQIWSKWECKDCGYIGVFIIEDGEMGEEIRKEYLKKKKKIQD